MKATHWLGFLVASLLVLSPAFAQAQARQLTDADYTRAAKFLGRSTDPLEGRNYDPRVYHDVQIVTWLDATHFWYRDDDGSCAHFFEMDAASGQVTPAFDQAKLAAAKLTSGTGRTRLASATRKVAGSP